MAEKNEKPEAAAPEGAAPAEVAAPKGGVVMAFLPLIIALVVAPVLSVALVKFYALPTIKTELLAAVGGEHGAAESAAAHGAEAKPEPKPEPKPEAKKGGHGGEAASTEGPGSFRFENVVVNLSGTMGTRYLKTSFLVTGKEDLRGLFESRQPQLLDATLNTLGSLTLSDLEEVGSRNLIRARLIAAYNEVIGVRVVDQIYFSDFVVQ